MLIKRLGAASTHVHVGTDRDEVRSRAFWRRVGWDNDMTIFSIYQSIPGDSKLQGIWESYAP